MMTLSLIYAFHFLLCKPFKRITSPLFTGTVKGEMSCNRVPPSVWPKIKIHQKKLFFLDLCPVEQTKRTQMALMKF